MATRRREGEEQTEDKDQVSSPRLKTLADAAAAAAQAKQWQARKNGMSNPGEPSEVRNLTHRVQLTSSANNPATRPAPSAVMIQITAAAVAVSITLRKLMD